MRLAVEQHDYLPFDSAVGTVLNAWPCAAIRFRSVLVPNGGSGTRKRSHRHVFNPEELERIVSLQQKSYQLLRWVNDALRSGTLNFNKVHHAADVSGAAQEWVGRHFHSIPGDARPDAAELEPFARLFASYLTTSFDLIAQPGTRRVSSSGCYCAFCSYLAAADHLRVRNPDKKARQRAQQMKDLYLSSLADEAGVALSSSDRESLLSDPKIANDLAFAAYGRELIRRSQFASQGEGVLVLWREIAWDQKGKVKKGFTLSAERILQAEAALVERLKQTPARA
jgi:hypothetical protein